MYTVYMLLFSDETYYIGVTNNIVRRFREHRRSRITSDWISFKILKEFDLEEEAYILEKNLVPDHVLRDKLCRNRTRGGRHPFNMRLGVTHTKETKLKISQSKKGVKLNLSNETIKNKSERIKGDKNPAKRKDIRAKLSERTKSNSKRRNQPGTMLGKKHSDSVIEKISYKINTPCGIFNSSYKAAKEFNISQQTVINRCKSEKFPEWWIISKGLKYNMLER